MGGNSSGGPLSRLRRSSIRARYTIVTAVLSLIAFTLIGAGLDHTVRNTIETNPADRGFAARRQVRPPPARHRLTLRVGSAVTMPISGPTNPRCRSNRNYFYLKTYKSTSNSMAA